MAKCKTPGRRKPRRAAPRAQQHGLDDDLAELAAVIAEFQLDNNVHGWFRPAWRDGWQAIELAWSSWGSLGWGIPTEYEQEISHWLFSMLARRTVTTDVYERAGDLIETLPSIGDMRRSKYLIAAFRCYQILIANSSGGGEVYNDVLKKAFDGIEIEEPLGYAEHILEYRCRDAIGTTAQLQGDANDRLRRAFRTAWQRGLYLAAYSLPPSVDYSVKPTVVKG